MNDAPLKLLARDDKDVQLVAAMVQDAVVPVAEMTFRPKEKSFVLIAHRFCWDRLEKKDRECFERISAALEVQGVVAARYTGFDPADQSAMLDLLTIKAQDGALNLIFAGEATLRLETEAGWSLRLEDFGAPWPTTRMPQHEAT